MFLFLPQAVLTHPAIMCSRQNHNRCASADLKIYNGDNISIACYINLKHFKNIALHILFLYETPTILTSVDIRGYEFQERTDTSDVSSTAQWYSLFNAGMNFSGFTNSNWKICQLFINIRVTFYQFFSKANRTHIFVFD